MTEDKSYIYLGFVANRYNNLKKGLDKESKKCWKVPINEDIFHDTILKCIDRIKYNDLTEDQVINYIFVSYKTNYVREQQYARNANREDVDITENIGGVTDVITPDYDMIKQAIIKEFGEKEWNLFEDYIRGTKVVDLEREDHEKGLYYRFNKIKSFIKRNFYMN